MSENINFIPANQLPEADGDEVSVLCVENGELKQKTASGLGGKTAYDLEVRITCTWDDEIGDVTATGEILSGSYDAVLEKLDAGIIPVCLLIECGTFWDGQGGKSVSECCPFWRCTPDGSEEWLTLSGVDTYSLQSDGTVWIE